jgi:hypothetical protein
MEVTGESVFSFWSASRSAMVEAGSPVTKDNPSCSSARRGCRHVLAVSSLRPSPASREGLVGNDWSRWLVQLPTIENRPHTDRRVWLEGSWRSSRGPRRSGAEAILAELRHRAISKTLEPKQLRTTTFARAEFAFRLRAVLEFCSRSPDTYVRFEAISTEHLVRKQATSRHYVTIPALPRNPVSTLTTSHILQQAILTRPRKTPYFLEKYVVYTERVRGSSPLPPTSLEHSAIRRKTAIARSCPRRSDTGRLAAWRP